MLTESLLKVFVYISTFVPRTMRLHTKCRGATYPGTNVQRLNVPDDKVPWTVRWPDYKPPEYSIPGLSPKPWADPELGYK
uniref:ADP-ribose pyrophosphatase n=1 Tax=Rhipicephalus appendiculatus TaxID=34631 RepID=A0A131YCB2_RHIAP